MTPKVMCIGPNLITASALSAKLTPKTMTLKVKIFENVFADSATGHRTTFRDQIWWKSAVAKFPTSRVDYHTKNSGSSWLVPASILSKMGRSPPKFSHCCHPLTCPRIPNLVRIGCVLPDLFRKGWFFGPKSQYDNVGFKPTNKVTEVVELSLYRCAYRLLYILD